MTRAMMKRARLLKVESPRFGDPEIAPETGWTLYDRDRVLDAASIEVMDNGDRASDAP
jgi:hypothetical protein